MGTTVNKTVIFLLSAFFLGAIAADAYSQEAGYTLLPVVLLMIVLLIGKPVYLFYLLILSIPWSVEYHLGANLSVDFPDEALMIMASVAALVYLIYHRNTINYKAHPLLIIILLQFVWTVITVITSTEIIFSVKYALAKAWYLFAFIALPIILFREERVVKRGAILLMCSMLGVMFLAIARHSEYYWSFEKVNEALKPFFINHVSYAALLVFTVPIQIAVIRLSSSRTIKIVAGCLLTVTAIALYLSYSRGSWIALLIGLLSYWMLRKRFLFPAFVGFIFLVVGSVFWLRSNDRFLKFSNDYRTTVFHSDFKQHLIATYKLKDLSNAERVYRWVAGVRMVPENWMTGTGPTSFYSQYKSYTVPAFKTYVSDNKEQSTVHNYFLLVAIEQGLPGVLLLVMLLASVFWYAQKVYRQASEKFWKVVAATIASIMVMQCTVNFLSDMIETDKVGSVFYLCIAALIVADIKTRKQSDLSTNVERIP